KFLKAIEPTQRAQIEGAIQQVNESDLPIIGLTYDAATKYAEWLSQQTGRKFRLPTPEEWVAGMIVSYASTDRQAIASFESQMLDWTVRSCQQVYMRLALGAADAGRDLHGECRMAITAGQINQGMRLLLQRTN